MNKKSSINLFSFNFFEHFKHKQLCPQSGRNISTLFKHIEHLSSESNILINDVLFVLHIGHLILIFCVFNGHVIDECNLS